LKQARTIRLLLPLVTTPAWALPATVLLGIISSLAESAGLTLFVPLLQSLDRKPFGSGDSIYFERFFGFVLSRLPAGNPLPYIVGLILAMTVVKGILTYSHSILAARINARVTHVLRSRLLA
jgi:subfamily B ATP-binding cassette protein MsbA